MFRTPSKTDQAKDAVAASVALSLSSTGRSAATWALTVTVSASLVLSVLLVVRNTCPPRVGRLSWSHPSPLAGFYALRGGRDPARAIPLCMRGSSP